jgi:peptide subunit release factor RF-3
MRWVELGDKTPQDLVIPTGTALAKDADGATVLLLGNAWALNYFTDKNPGIKTSLLPFTATVAAEK